MSKIEKAKERLKSIPKDYTYSEAKSLLVRLGFMNNVLEYKGYYTAIKINFERHELYGKIEGISDLVNFISDSLSGIEQEFHNAVDNYLEFCQEVGKIPVSPVQCAIMA